MSPQSPEPTADTHGTTLEAKRLSNPVYAAKYLSQIETTAPGMVLTATMNVIKGREVSSVKETGVARENIYPAFSQQGRSKLHEVAVKD